MRCLILTVLALAASSLAEEPTTYQNFKVYQVTPRTDEQAKVLVGFKKFDGEVDFWSEMRVLNNPVDVMVAPRLQEPFVNSLEANNIEYLELISNVETAFQKERLRQSMSPPVENGKINFVQFHRYSVIENYLKQLAKDYPQITTLTIAANSTNNRQIYSLKISTGGATKKPIIFIDGGIHAREWISPSTVLYIINQLVENSANRYMIENVDWYIVPVLNPDGYEYTHTNARLWRKTRSPGNYCYGVDGNRNFDFHWMEVGASNNECSETFAGPRPLSEPEMKAVTNMVARHGSDIKLYLTFHSCGQYILYPWGYTSALPNNWKELDNLGRDVDRAIAAVYGTRYTVGSSTNVLYAAAGGSDDYVMAIGGTPLTYTVELPCGGSAGFDPPPSRIAPVAKETFEGVKTYYRYIANKYAVKNE